MLRELLLAGLLAVSLAAGGLALATGFGPAAGDSGDDLESFPTATPTASGGATTGGTDTRATATTPTPVAQPFAITVDRVEACDTTCRDVTVSLTNRQREAATDVVVYTRVFAGNGTDEADLVWSGEEPVGHLGAGETHTSTRHVELTYAEAHEVQAADGWVTVQTTVRTADRTVTFTERLTVD